MDKKRGDAEFQCLTKARDRFLFISDKEASLSFPPSIKSESFRFCYGINPEEGQVVADLLTTAEPNPNPSEFPDFLCAHGFIEHFQISAAKSTRKGSLFEKERSQFEQRDAQQLTALTQKINEPENRGVLHSTSSAFCYPERTHKALLESLDKQWSKHLKSFAKYTVDYEVEHSAFMVECREAGIYMFDSDYLDPQMDGRSYGDLARQEHLCNYHLSRDSQALKWIHENARGIEYVFFVGVDCSEIIRVGSIPNMLHLLPRQYCVKAGPTTEVVKHVAVSE